MVGFIIAHKSRGTVYNKQVLWRAGVLQRMQEREGALTGRSVNEAEGERRVHLKGKENKVKEKEKKKKKKKE